MRNLAAEEGINDFVAEELIEAGIPVKATIVVIYPDEGSSVLKKCEWIPKLSFKQMNYLDNEVPANYYGVLNGWRFTRSWSYWVAHGIMDLEPAWKIYNDPIGRKSVRAHGDCGCVEPTYPEGKSKFVAVYHVDTQEGLNLLVKIIKETQK